MKDKQNDEKNEENGDKLIELEGKYLRALADYQNLEKQTQVWREDFIKFANQGLITQLLEIIDDLEKAQEHLNDEGLKIVLDKLRRILKDRGVEEISVLGNEYDPEFSEAVGMEKGDSDNVIVRIIQKGYKLNGKVVRAAKVVVSRSEQS